MTGINRREQLDGLRAISMSSVLYVHYWNPTPNIEYIRVELFFILSGFLISITISNAMRPQTNLILVNFYIRRMMRLLPALAIFLILAFSFDMDGISESIIWHATQMSNTYFALHETWKPWVAAHLWSLNVIEQFYLSAPLILLLPRKFSIIIYSALVAICLIFRENYTDIGITKWHRDMFFSFDPIAVGALIALMKDQKFLQSALTSKISNLIAFAILTSPWIIPGHFGGTELYRFLSIYALCSIVFSAYIGYAGFAASILANPITRYLSRISYGVYIYHTGVWWFIGERFPHLYFHNFTTFATMSFCVIIVASISWYAIEQHFDKLKILFPIVKHPRLAEAK